MRYASGGGMCVCVCVCVCDLRMCVGRGGCSYIASGLCCTLYNGGELALYTLDSLPVVPQLW